jgi:hypothetical protein
MLKTLKTLITLKISSFSFNKGNQDHDFYILGLVTKVRFNIVLSSKVINNFSKRMLLSIFLDIHDFVPERRFKTQLNCLLKRSFILRPINK